MRRRGECRRRGSGKQASARRACSSAARESASQRRESSSSARASASRSAALRRARLGARACAERAAEIASASRASHLACRARALAAFARAPRLVLRVRLRVALRVDARAVVLRGRARQAPAASDVRGVDLRSSGGGSGAAARERSGRVTQGRLRAPRAAARGCARAPARACAAAAAPAPPRAPAAAPARSAPAPTRTQPRVSARSRRLCALRHARARARACSTPRRAMYSWLRRMCASRCSSYSVKPDAPASAFASALAPALALVLPAAPAAGAGAAAAAPAAAFFAPRGGIAAERARGWRGSSATRAGANNSGGPRFWRERRWAHRRRARPWRRARIRTRTSPPSPTAFAGARAPRRHALRCRAHRRLSVVVAPPLLR